MIHSYYLVLRSLAEARELANTDAGGNTAQDGGANDGSPAFSKPSMAEETRILVAKAAPTPVQSQPPVRCLLNSRWMACTVSAEVARVGFGLAIVAEALGTV